jgi:hypothetical protein
MHSRNLVGSVYYHPDDVLEVPKEDIKINRINVGDEIN